MSEREDIYSGNKIEWRWVIVGSLIVVGTQTLIGAALCALETSDAVGVGARC